MERVKWNKTSNSFPTDQTSALGANEVWLIAFSSGIEKVNEVAGANSPPGTPRADGDDYNGGLGGEFIKYYDDAKDIAFQYANVDSGKSISFSDVLKITYTGSTFEAGTSEVPKPASARMTPFGEDNPLFGADLCYPPYTTADSLLKNTAISDPGGSGLYQASGTDYDVFWGDSTAPSLGGKSLNITRGIDFSYSTDDPSGGEPNSGDLVQESDIVKSYTPGTHGPALKGADFTHRFRVGFPLAGEAEDVQQHIGNLELVKNSYSLYVNGYVTATDPSSGKMAGLL